MMDDATFRDLMHQGVEADTLPEDKAIAILDNIIKSLTEQDVLHEDNFQVGVNARDEMLVDEEIMDRVQDYKNHAGMKAPAFMRGDEIPAFA